MVSPASDVGRNATFNVTVPLKEALGMVVEIMVVVKVGPEASGNMFPFSLVQLRSMVLRVKCTPGAGPVDGEQLGPSNTPLSGTSVFPHLVLLDTRPPLHLLLMLILLLFHHQLCL